MIPLYGIMVFGIAVTGLVACTTPSAIRLPDAAVLKERNIELHDISKLPPPVIRIMAGDSLRIVRDADETGKNAESVFMVRPDGAFSYPYAGTIRAAGRTLDEIADELTGKLRSTYRQPKVTINIASTPGNRIFVGGAVRNPASFELEPINTIEQAIISAGGVLPSADSTHIALLRMDENGLYQVYFTNLSQILKPSENARGVQLVRGDVVFVPKSAIGNAVEGVDLYVNQLLPFSRSIGLGFTYIVKQPDNSSR